MLSKELITLAIEELAPLIEKQEVSPVELTDAVLDQVEALNEQNNAYISITQESAKKAAKQAEREIAEGNYRGKLHGIPMGIKDNIYLKDEVTTMASKIHRDFVSDYDATVIEKLRDSGVVFTGKLNMHEYAWGITNNNPHFGPPKPVGFGEDSRRIQWRFGCGHCGQYEYRDVGDGYGRFYPDSIIGLWDCRVEADAWSCQ